MFIRRVKNVTITPSIVFHRDESITNALSFDIDFLSRPASNILQFRNRSRFHIITIIIIYITIFNSTWHFFNRSDIINESIRVKILFLISNSLLICRQILSKIRISSQNTDDIRTCLSLKSDIYIRNAKYVKPRVHTVMGYKTPVVAIAIVCDG